MKNYSRVKIDPTSFMKGRKKVINQPIYFKIQTVDFLLAYTHMFSFMEVETKDTNVAHVS